MKIKPCELQKSILMLATESNKIPQKVKDEMKKNLLTKINDKTIVGLPTSVMKVVKGTGKKKCKIMKEAPGSAFSLTQPWVVGVWGMC